MLDGYEYLINKCLGYALSVHDSLPTGDLREDGRALLREPCQRRDKRCPAGLDPGGGFRYTDNVQV
jgi:hypothetical protein